MSKKSIVILIVVAAVLLLIVAPISWAISTYNGLVQAEETVNQSMADIDAQLQRRADLIPNLVSTVKGYAAHETEVFTAVSDARAALAGASTVADKAEADAATSSALSRLLAIAEAYPELKANTNFIALQDQLEGTENRISVAREDYNETATEFNKSLRTFPRSIIAGMFGFEKVELFKAAESAQTNPTVSFE